MEATVRSPDVSQTLSTNLNASIPIMLRECLLIREHFDIREAGVFAFDGAICEFGRFMDTFCQVHFYMVCNLSNPYLPRYLRNNNGPEPNITIIEQHQ
jgi:hypothetical protein